MSRCTVAEKALAMKWHMIVVTMVDVVGGTCSLCAGCVAGVVGQKILTK